MNVFSTICAVKGSYLEPPEAKLTPLRRSPGCITSTYMVILSLVRDYYTRDSVLYIKFSIVY